VAVIASRMEDAYKLRLNYICFIYIKIGTTVCVYNNELYYCTVLYLLLFDVTANRFKRSDPSVSILLV
jgi:hypothetical protein